MGYTSHITGEITVTPPIPWGELQSNPAGPFYRTSDNKEWDRLTWLRLVEEPVETRDGTLIRKQAIAIRPSEADELRVDGLGREVQAILDAHPGHTFDGVLLVTGEESPDIWRVRIIDGRAVEERPRIVWPDGTEHTA
ncbi:DUF6205 family protein [[Actinomadura] parvosata]|uniref:DUF6205 family protein n=1 Tax=[Actinomadura] parvosata TaxID=1955412 RepID=UPI00406BF0BE